MDRPRRGTDRRRTAIPRGVNARRTSCRDGGGLRRELRLARGRRESAAHPELVERKVVDIAAERGCTPLDVMLDLSLDENLETRFASVLANNDPEAIAGCCPQETVLLGLADSGRARQPALRRVLRHRPARQLGAGQGRDAARARDPQAERRTGRGVRARTTAARSRSARRPTSSCSTTTTVAPGPLRRIRDFPADGERLVADQPVGVRHVMVNGTVIRSDGAEAPGALEQRPGKLLRS